MPSCMQINFLEYKLENSKYMSLRVCPFHRATQQSSHQPTTQLVLNPFPLVFLFGCRIIVNIQTWKEIYE